MNVKKNKHKPNLLNKLRGNAHKHLSNIASDLGKPITTVFEAEKELRRRGIITRYYSQINFESVGFPIRAAFLLNIKSKSFEKTIVKLEKNINVNTLQILKGKNNLFVEAIFKNVQQFLNFSEKIRAEEVHYLTAELKTEGAVIKQIV